MHALRTRPRLAVLLLPLAAACAAAGGGAAPAEPAPTTAAAEFEALFQARADSARMRFTEADVRFMTGMIHHHAQALELARLAPTHSVTPSIRTLAARIDNAQRDEIALMQRWLRDRGQPVPELHEMGGRVMVHGAGGHGHDGHHDMPGMLTREQIAELERTRGPAFDRLFLTLMIQHHAGAVQVVRELFATDGAAQD